MKRLISILTFMFILVGSMSADEGEYGGYDRPTHFPDFEFPTHYADNMSCMLHVLTADGEILHNYEVAVYDQNNSLRSVNRSRKNDNDCCVLTILGTDDDVFHFEIVYGDFDNPEVCPAVDTLQFSSDGIVGRDTPFYLTLASSPGAAITNQHRVTSLSSLSYDLSGRLIAHQTANCIIINNRKKTVRINK